MHLIDLLTRAASASPDAVAVVYRGMRSTYGELLQTVEHAAATLVGRGVRPGDRVPVVAGNHPGFVVGLFGALRAGATAIPVDPQFRLRELERTLADTAPRALVADEERLEICSQLQTLSTQVVVVDEAGRLNGGAAPRGPLPDLPGEDAPAIGQHSTGTTGRPKRVERTHRQIRSEVDAIHARLGTGEDDVFLGCIPLFHAHGLCNALLAPLRCRGRLVLTGGFYARSILNLVEAEAVTLWPTVPFMVRILTEMPGPATRPLPSLRLVFSAGAPLDPRVALRFGERYGAVVRQLYGCTEMGAVTVNDAGPAPDTLDSVGTPLQGASVRIVGPDGASLPPGTVGQVAIRGVGLADGYADADDTARAAFRGGEFLPGDLGELDTDGRLRLRGRTRLFINVGGKKVDPEEVEEVLRDHPDVADVAVVRAPHDYYGEIVRAVLVPREGTRPDPNDLRRHCRAALSDYKVPKELLFRDAIPRSATGKILRKYLEDEDLGG